MSPKMSFRALCTSISLLSLSTLTTSAIIPRAVPTSLDFDWGFQAVKATRNPFGSGGRGRTGSTSSTSFVELQLNLCNSGFAGCYEDGKSIPEGSDLIYETGPNVVTVNEICSNNVATLQAALAEAWPQDYTYSVFMPVYDEDVKGPFKCKDSTYNYGSVVMGRISAAAWTGAAGIVPYGGKYTKQDDTKESRIFACAAAQDDHFVCTTHLSSKSQSLAMTQCKAFMSDAIPYLRSHAGSTARTVVGGDFNLKYDPLIGKNVQDCVPSGWTRKGDGNVQHVLFTNDLAFVDRKDYEMDFTDHVGWLVKTKDA
ncbi:hypothetical protein M011DRAFT_471574 [Sporormia fimetaria CBS 119925]|uniref:Endonuclease/exonuclease/phosphatase domain-containing protein n=1 Tax=Sporormia fimetaria CBS 119925 TaxID=1340428 RepID=A0A6A6V0F5_9PLEO|nr:hypothetical protein M011DRAFT_471574 [Sporormia fimetaria CBS 119925]